MKNFFFALLYTSYSFSALTFTQNNLIFQKDVTIENNFYCTAPLAIETFSINNTCNINGKIKINELTIGNLNEKSIIFLFGIPQSMAMNYFLVIDETTGNLYKSKIEKNKDNVSNNQNIYRNVLTNKIESSNKNTLFIQNINHQQSKTNIFFNTNNLKINSKTLFINNLHGKNNTIIFKKPIEVTESILLEDLINNTQIIATNNIEIENKNRFNIEAKNTFTIKNIKNSNIEIITKNIVLENISPESNYSFENLKNQTNNYYCTSNQGEIQKIKKENVNFTIRTIQSDQQAMAFNCNDIFLSSYTPGFFMFNTSYSAASGATIDLLTLSEKFLITTANLDTSKSNNVSITLGNGSTTNLLFDLKTNPQREIVNLTVKNLIAKNVTNFNNQIKVTNQTIIDGALYLEPCPLPNFTDYVVVSDHILPADLNVVPFPRTKMKFSNLKKILNIEKLKSKNLIENKNNIFFELIFLVKEIYKKISLSNKIITKLQKTASLYQELQKNFEEINKKVINDITTLKEYMQDSGNIENKSKIKNKIELLKRCLTESGK